MRIRACGSSPALWIFFSPGGSHWSQAERGQRRLTAQPVAWHQEPSHCEQEPSVPRCIIIWERTKKTSAAVSLRWCYSKPSWPRGVFPRKMQSHLMQALLQDSLLPSCLFLIKRKPELMVFACVSSLVALSRAGCILQLIRRMEGRQDLISIFKAPGEGMLAKLHNSKFHWNQTVPVP